MNIDDSQVRFSVNVVIAGERSTADRGDAVVFPFVETNNNVYSEEFHVWTWFQFKQRQQQQLHAS